MSVNNNKPKAASPVVSLREEPSSMGRYMVLLVPSLFGSIILHVVLFAIFFLIMLPAGATEKLEEATREVNNIQADDSQPEKASFSTVDVDPAATEADTDIQYMNERIAEVSVPGSNNPNEAVGIHDGDKSAPPVNLPAPGGFGSKGQGGALEALTGPGNSNAVGEVGGYGPRGMPLQGSFYGRSGATREYALRDGGGTTESEAAVARGLKWLARQQMPDGRWMLNSPNLPDKDRGSESNDIAATALGLLPLLAAGKTHKPAAKNEYDKVIDKGLKFLMRSQDQKTGFFGGTMYSHGLAAIAMCEAYGLSQDPILRRPAQNSINLIVNIQHEGGGWRYGPAKSGGDLSITGWQIMAIKSAQMSGLDVPSVAVARAKKFLDSCCSSANPSNQTGDEGYHYVPGADGSTPRMTAVGLLCRQYMENWGPSHPRMIKAIGTVIEKNPPARQDVYYYYYATQVMHHFGGEKWREWNDKMREFLIKGQEKSDKSRQLRQLEPGRRSMGPARRPPDAHLPQPPDARSLLPLPPPLLPRRRLQDG